jgi:hypothetical protein
MTGMTGRAALMTSLRLLLWAIALTMLSAALEYAIVCVLMGGPVWAAYIAFCVTWGAVRSSK